MALNETFRDEMKTALLAEKGRLEAELGRFADKTEVPGDYEARFEDIGTDRDDNATEVEQYADNIALEESLERRLSEVTDALSRIADGTYGTCSVCGKDIEEDRLRAYPSGKECMTCLRK